MNFFRLTICLVWFSLMLGPLGHANDPLPVAAGPEELFSQGVALYQAQKYAEAEEKFRAALAASPDNPAILINWGLAAYQSDKKGLGLAAWRRALALRPDLQAARQALAHGQRELGIHEAPGASSWDRLITGILSYATLDQLLAALALLLAPTGWIFLTYSARRREATRTEQPFPPLPLAGTVLALGLLLALSLTALKFSQELTPRATVITKGAAVFSGPTASSSKLFDLNEGVDVVLRRQNNGWSQIRHSGGLSGWVEANSLFITSGRLLW